MNAPENIIAPKVFNAIAAVTAHLAREGISKNRTNDQQGYKFRGIDDVYNALSSCLSTYHLCIVPRVLSRTQEERVTAKGTPIFFTTVQVEYRVICAIDGSEVTAVTYGEAMDSGDKSTNKAMSAAYKYLAMQLFCIPTEGDNDADQTTHEVKAKPKSVARDAFDSLPQEDQEYLRGMAMPIKAHISALRLDEALALFNVATGELSDSDAAFKAAFWSLFDSKERTYLKASAKPMESK